MAYTPLTNTFRVSAITHTGTIVDPIGGGYDETIGWTESRPGTRLAPVSAIDTYSLEGTIRYQNQQAPIVRGTSASLAFTLLCYDGTSTKVVTITTMLAGAARADYNSKPHVNEQKFQYTSGNTENLAPISVA